jgi:hypothetical protein
MLKFGACWGILLVICGLVCGGTLREYFLGVKILWVILQVIKSRTWLFWLFANFFLIWSTVFFTVAKIIQKIAKKK